MLVFCRNKRKYELGDELSATSQAMEGLRVMNGLECKIACSSSKVCFVKFSCGNRVLVWKHFFFYSNFIPKTNQDFFVLNIGLLVCVRSPTS